MHESYSLRLCSLGWNGMSGQWNMKNYIEILWERRKYEIIVTIYEWVQISCDTDCKETWRRNEMTIPSKTRGLEF